MKSLVTGGAGFIGSHLVDKLLEIGHDVVVIDDFSLGKEENLEQHKGNKSLKIYKRSICEDLSSIFKMEKFDVVFHLAAIPGVQFSIENPIKSHDININGTLNILELSRKHRVRRFIFSSSASVYGDQSKRVLTEELSPNPMSPYALHKLAGEYYARLYYKLYGLETIALRYFNLFGPRQDPESAYAGLIPKFMKLAIKDSRPTINGDGKQDRDFIYVADVVRANILAATTQNNNCFGEVFNIGSGKSISVNAITRKIFDIVGFNKQPLYGPALIEPRTSLSGITKARKLLDWRPEYGLEDSLTKTFDFIAQKIVI